jgi:hypothetical protein
MPTSAPSSASAILPGLSGQVIAIPFRSLKLNDSSGYNVLPGASRAALETLPVFVNNK